MGKQNEHYSKEEAQRRMEAALRGARAVGHKQMKNIKRKRVKARRTQEEKEKR